MAYLHTLLSNTEEGPHSYTFFAYHRTSEKFREEERSAAITIQSWFRSLQVQLHIKFLHRCAIYIQKFYRAYVARKLYRARVNEVRALVMRLHYDAMATRIQALWRGHSVRKFRADFYRRREYLNGVVQVNELTLSKLHEVGEVNVLRKELLEEERLAARKLFTNRKTHYLLSTQVCDGIYNSPVRPKVDKEKALASVEPFSREERERMMAEKEERLLRSSTGIPRVESLEKPQKLATLPPITNKKVQGPFRSPLEVQKQRHKPLAPTLRVETDYVSVEEARVKLREEEWTKRVLDDAFLPCRKTVDHYEPTLHTTSTYGSLNYGTKHFRSEGERSEKVIHAKSFQRVVPPIPYFDHVGKSY